MREKWNKWLPYGFLLLAALSRWPGVFPPNFSAFYALAFCAGAFFSSRVKWWLPLATIVLTDVALNLYYLFTLHIQPFSLTQLVNYGAFLLIIWFGTRFSRRSSFLSLLSGGILGAILFYFITNTASWIANSEYSKDLAGWIIALTRGTSGYPTTIQFFINTLLSGGLFTGLFAGAFKLSEAAEPAEEKEPEEETEAPEGEKAPEPTKA